jgi:hypothetical protein
MRLSNTQKEAIRIISRMTNAEIEALEQWAETDRLTVMNTPSHKRQAMINDPTRLDNAHLYNYYQEVLGLPTLIKHHLEHKKQWEERQAQLVKTAFDTEPAAEKARREQELTTLKRELESQRLTERKDRDTQINNISYFFDAGQDTINLYFEAPHKLSDSPVSDLIEKTGRVYTCRLHGNIVGTLSTVEMHISAENQGEHRKFLLDSLNEVWDAEVANNESKRKEKLHELEERQKGEVINSYYKRKEHEEYLSKKRQQADVLKRLGIQPKPPELKPFKMVRG